MTDIYDQYFQENTLEKAPSQNLGKDVFTSENEENETPGFNVYDEFFRQQETSVNNQVKRSLQLVMEKDPDMVGEGLHLANELGLDRNFALDSDEAIKLMREKKKRDRIESFELAKYSPILHRQLTDPTFAALAYDNIDNLQGLEKLFDDFKSIPENISQGWAKGRLQVKRGHIGVDKWLGKTDEKLDFQLAEIDERLKAFEADGTGIFEEGFAIFGQYSKSLPKAFGLGGAGWVTGAAVGSWTGPGSIITAKGGFIAGFMSSLAYDSLAIEGGNMYLDLSNEGFNPTHSRWISLGTGIVSAGLEIWGASIVSAPLRKFLIQQTTKQVVKQLAKPSGKAALGHFLKSWAGRSGAEGGTEVAQQLSQILGREIAVLYDDREDINSRLTTWEGINGVASELAMTFYRTMQGMVLVGGITGAPTFISDVKKSQNAKRDEVFFNELENNINTSKLKERSQEEFQNLTQTIGDEKGVSEIYVDSYAFVNSMLQAGITIEDVEQVSPIVAEQLKELEKSGTISGGDIVIPIGEYSSKLVGTDFDNILKQHRRLDREDSFSREENTYYEANKEKLEKEANEILTKTQSQNKEFRESAAKVKKDFVNMVRQSISHLNKPYSKKDIRYAASFYQAYVVTQANKLGILPTEFAKRFPYRVVGTDQVQISPEQQLFSQDGTVKTDSAAFQNWFGNSILKDEKGTPRVLYHGTKDSFSEFDLEHSNKKDYGWLGRAVYLTDGDKAAISAKGHAINKKGKMDDIKVMPLYVRLENPYYATAEEKNANRLGGENAAKGFKDRLIAEGYDGVILKGDRPGIADEVAVFDPAAVKSTSNSGAWSREIANIYKQQELLRQLRQQKQGKPVPQAVYQIANLVESFNFAEKNIYETNRDFKIALQKRVNDEAKKARVDLTENTVERDNYLIQTVLADARYALSENDNAIGWYDTTLTKAKAILSLIHPELATNPEANFAFVYALANTSNMIKVDKNLELAEQAYTYWKENGEFPTKIGIGDASQAINRNFKLYNRLIKEKGFAELENYLKTMHPVKEIETYTNDEVSGLNKNDMAYGAAVMGPKIGNGFFANLYGNYEQLTMDRWLIRTWGRMTGTLVLDYRKQAKVKRGQLKQLIKALSLKDKKKLEAIINTKIKLSDLDEVAIAIQRASTKESNRILMNEIATVVEEPGRKQFLLDLLGTPQKRYPQISIGGEIRKGGNALAKYNDGQKETPSGAPERRNITKVFTQVLDTLQQEQPDLTMADLQALLWYPEKRLYDSAKLDADEIVRGYEADEAPDYANASVNLAKQLGVSEADIQTTLEEVTNELLERKATERTADSERGEGGDGRVRETDTFQQQGKDDRNIDEATGLPINPDGTVTVYHHTDKQSASLIYATNQLRSAGEPDVYVTTRAVTDTGYGDTAVAIRVEPSRLSLDDEFPDGRRDFRLSVGEPGGSIQVGVGEYTNQAAQKGVGRINEVSIESPDEISITDLKRIHALSGLTRFPPGEQTQRAEKRKRQLRERNENWTSEQIDEFFALSEKERQEINEAYFALKDLEEGGGLFRQGREQTDEEAYADWEKYGPHGDKWWKRRVLDAANFIGEGLWKAEMGISDRYYALRERMDGMLPDIERIDAEKTQERIERQLAEFDELHGDNRWREIPEGQTRRATIPVGRAQEDGSVFIERTDLSALQHIANQEGVLNKIMAGFVLATGNLPHNYEISVGEVGYGVDMTDADLKKAGVERVENSLKHLSKLQKLRLLKANFDRVRGELPVGLYRMWGSTESRRKLYHRWFKNDPDVVWVDSYTGERKTSSEAAKDLDGITPHLLITDWTKTYKQQVFHGTSPEAAALIVSTGVDFSSKAYGIMGEGFYVTTDRDYATVYGPEVVEGLLPDSAKILDITGRNAFQWAEEVGIGKPAESVDMDSHIQEIFSDEQKDQITQWAKDNNYDGIKFDPNPLVMGEERTADESLIPEIVLFNKDLADQIVKKQQDYFNQGQDDARGGFNPKTLTTFLHKEADISTFFHETAHFMLTVTEDLVLSGQATPDIQKDFDVLLDFWGVESVDAWRNLSFEEKRKYHESFAYNYEIYLTEEKAAPSVELQDVFVRFGNFIRNLYKSIRDDLNKLYRDENGTDLPVLTDEVRAVMDRLVASEDQIIQSQRVYEMRPMFETQEQSNMDNETWQEYRDAIEKAQNEAIDDLSKVSIKELRLLENKSKSLKKLQDKETRETRKRIKEEETVKAENETLYKLQRFLKKGEWNDKDDNPFKSAGTHKLDIESVRNLVPFHDMQSEIKALGTGQWGMVGKNGLPVEMVAELFGFETAEEMINGLIALDPIKEVIKERTDERMINEFSELTDPKKRELKIQQALNNKARAKFLAIELKFLTKATQPVRLQVAAARQVAKSILSKTRIKDIRPVKYAQNERRARKDLEKAMRTGDDRGAIEAKRSELINSQLNREATKIIEEYNNAVKRYKNLFKRSDEKIAKSKTLTVDYVNAAQEILSHYGLGPQLEEGTSFVDNLKKYDEHIWEEVQPIIADAQRLPGRELKDLTLQDFNTLDEVIESLLYQARRDQQFKVEGELRERGEVSGELVTALDNMDARASVAFGEGGQTKWWERMISGLEGIKATLRRVEHWCDSKDGEGSPRVIRGGGVLGGGVIVPAEGEAAGPFTRYIWRTLKDPIVEWRTERPKWTGRYVDLLKQVDWSQGKINAPELVSPTGQAYVFGRERGMGKAELLGAMLHTGNKGNLTKLLVGRGWGTIREDGTLDSSNWQRFQQRMIDEGHLTKKDFDFLQAVWDLNEELLPLTQRAHKDVFGYYFKTIEVTPLVTKFGTYRGGYVPAVADPEMSKRELTLDQTIKAIKDEMKYAAPAVERGFTKPRTQAMRPLSLNLGLQAAHIDNALRFAYIQPAVTDLLRLFRDRKFSNALNRVDDKAMKGMLIPWLRNAASQKTTLGNNTLLDKGITRITRSTSLNYMFLSLKNGMQQVTGKLPARLKIEHKYLNDAFRRYTSAPHKVAKEVAEMSPFMRDRQINQMFDVQDIMNDLIINPKKYEKFQKWVGKNSYFVQQAFQNYVDSVVWIAKYNQVLTNAPKTMTEAQIHAEAIQQADGAVRMTQDSLLPEDVAAYQINHPFYKAVFQFTSYFNAQANLNATRYKSLIKELGWNSKQFSGQVLFTFLFGFALPALVSEGIQELASGGLADEDEDGYIDEFFEFGYMSLFRYGTAFVPTGSSFLMVPLNMLDDKPYNDRITISPSISLINSTMQGTTRMLINLSDPDKEVKGNEVRSVITLMGLLSGLPLYPFAKPIGLLYDLKDGRWVPRGPLDLVRGLVTGQAGEGRRK